MATSATSTDKTFVAWYSCSCHSDCTLPVLVANPGELVGICDNRGLTDEPQPPDASLDLQSGELTLSDTARASRKWFEGCFVQDIGSGRVLDIVGTPPGRAVKKVDLPPGTDVGRLAESIRTSGAWK